LKKLNFSKKLKYVIKIYFSEAETRKQSMLFEKTSISISRNQPVICCLALLFRFKLFQARSDADVDVLLKFTWKFEAHAFGVIVNQSW